LPFQSLCAPRGFGRRILLRWLAALRPLRAWAQTAAFPADQAESLRLLAALVLPSELGAAGLENAAAQFERWVRDYRPGAEMDHGYGFTRLRSKPPSPASTYLRQLQELRLTGDLQSDRAAVEAALDQSNIAALPLTPDGKHVASDLMAFFFRSSAANDLCYRARIGRDECRGLPGSGREPARMETSGGGGQ
jgi:hypothetical protein